MTVKAHHVMYTTNNTGLLTLKGSKGSKADRSEGLPENSPPTLRPLGDEENGSPVGMENAANGSFDWLEENGSERPLLSSSLAPPPPAESSPPSSRWELVLNPLILDTGLLEPACACVCDV